MLDLTRSSQAWCSLPPKPPQAAHSLQFACRASKWAGAGGWVWRKQRRTRQSVRSQWEGRLGPLTLTCFYPPKRRAPLTAIKKKPRRLLKGSGFPYALLSAPHEQFVGRGPNRGVTKINPPRRHGSTQGPVRPGLSIRDLECTERIEYVGHRGIQSRGWLRCLYHWTADMR